MMADIRNDIIELQEKVFGDKRGISLDSFPSGGEPDFAEWGSGQGVFNAAKSALIRWKIANTAQ